jgi:hypothetical protein
MEFDPSRPIRRRSRRRRRSGSAAGCTPGKGHGLGMKHSIFPVGG